MKYPCHFSKTQSHSRLPGSVALKIFLLFFPLCSLNLRYVIEVSVESKLDPLFLPIVQLWFPDVLHLNEKGKQKAFIAVGVRKVNTGK